MNEIKLKIKCRSSSTGSSTDSWWPCTLCIFWSVPRPEIRKWLSTKIYEMKSSNIIANIMAGFSIFVTLLIPYIGYFSLLLGYSNFSIFRQVTARLVTTRTQRWPYFWSWLHRALTTVTIKFYQGSRRIWTPQSTIKVMKGTANAF